MKKLIAACTAALLSVGIVGIIAAPAQAEDAPPAETVEVAAPVEVVVPEVEAPAPPAADPVTPEAEPVVVEPVAVEEPAAVVEEEPAPEARVATAAVADEDYVTVAWHATEGDIWNPAQTVAFTQETEDPDLSALDDELAGVKDTLKCGTSAYFQVDVYIDSAITDALLAGGVLYGPSNPQEDLIKGGDGTAWKYVKVVAADCPPPVTNGCVAGPGTHSTNLNDLWSNVDTRSAGHLEYVDGGLHIWTDDASSQAKVSEGMATSFALKNTGTIGIDWVGSTPPPGVNLFVNFGADGNGTLVYESVYGQDLWLTNGSSATVKANAPVIGGGNGSQWHGTIDQWLTKYPDAQVTGIAYSLGSGVKGDGVIQSITVNCNVHTFDFENASLPEPKSTYTEWVDGEYECDDTTVEQTRTRVDYTYTNAPDGSVVEHVSDPVTETQTRQLEKSEIEVCPTETTPPAPPTEGLALTGSSPLGGILFVTFLLLAGTALVGARVRYDRTHPVDSE